MNAKNYSDIIELQRFFICVFIRPDRKPVEEHRTEQQLVPLAD